MCSSLGIYLEGSADHWSDIVGFMTGLSRVSFLGSTLSGEGGQPEALLEEGLAL